MTVWVSNCQRTSTRRKRHRMRRGAADVSETLHHHTASVVESGNISHFALCQLIRDMAVRCEPYSQCLEAMFPRSSCDFDIRHCDVCVQECQWLSNTILPPDMQFEVQVVPRVHSVLEPCTEVRRKTSRLSSNCPRTATIPDTARPLVPPASQFDVSRRKLLLHQTDQPHEDPLAEPSACVSSLVS